MSVTMYPAQFNMRENSSYEQLPAIRGEGVPSGGTTGQVLTKASGTDFDTSWQPQIAVEVSDKFYKVRFDDFMPDLNLFGITFYTSSNVYYRLVLGTATTQKEMFMEKNDNGTVTRIWTATVT